MARPIPRAAPVTSTALPVKSPVESICRAYMNDETSVNPVQPRDVARTLDLDFVRSQFPAFAEPSLKGQAFFENAGGSYACAPVIARLTEYYRRLKVQPSR